MSIKQIKTLRQKVTSATIPVLERDELLEEIEKLELAIQKMTKRSKEERERSIDGIMNSLGGMSDVEARKHIVDAFDKEFFENEYDIKYKEELATRLYEFCKKQLDWNYTFLKRQAFIL